MANITHGGDRRSDQAANLPVVSQAEAADLLNSWQICHKLEARRGNEFPDKASLPEREPSKARDEGEVQIQTSPTLEGAADLLNLL